MSNAVLSIFIHTNIMSTHLNLGSCEKNGFIIILFNAMRNPQQLYLQYKFQTEMIQIHSN